MSARQPVYLFLFLLLGSVSIVSSQEPPSQGTQPILEDPQQRDAAQLLNDAHTSRSENRLQESVVLGYLALKAADRSPPTAAVMKARTHLFLSEVMGEIGYRAFERIHAKAAYQEWEEHDLVRAHLEPELFHVRLGIVAMQSGEFSIANYHLRQALEGYQAAQPSKLVGEVSTHIHLAQLALKQANVSRMMDQESLAVVNEGHIHLDAALALTEKVSDRPELSQMINELQGEFLLRLSSHLPKDKHTLAHTLLKQAENIFRHALNNRPNISSTSLHDQVGLLNNLSSVMRRTARYVEAMDFSDRVLSLTEQRQRGDPDVVLNMALTSAHLQNHDLLTTLCSMIMNLEDARIREVSSKSSEGLSLSYLAQGRYQSMVCLALLSKTASQDVRHARQMLDLILRRKAIVTESEQSFWKTLHGQSATDLQNTRKNLVALRNHLSTKVAKGEHKGLWRLINFIEGQEAILSVEPWWRDFQRQSSHSPERQTVTEYAESIAEGKGGWEATSSQTELLEEEKVTVTHVAASLPPDAVMVEFNKVDEFDLEREIFTNASRYWALLLFPSGQTTAIDLGDADTLEHQITNSLQILHSSDRLLHEPQFLAMSDLYNVLWAPIADALGTTTTIMLSPDDALALVPFSALLAPDGRFLIENHTLYQVTTGRIFHTNEEEVAPTSRQSVVVADPDYGSLQDRTAAEATNTGMGRSIPSSQPLSQLKATLNEGKMIKEVLGKHVQLLTGKDASEASVRAVEQPRVFHLATHGLFLKNLALEPRENLSKEDAAALDSAYVQHVQALSRSGLALSHFNVGGTKNDEDAFLTAYDVAGMNLTGTDLVVLSGCDTGLGDTFAGEGVLGLRRAFQIAGARYVVMSLWPLQDKEAVRQMREFYKAYTAGKTPVLALQDMQRERISWLRNALGYAPPAMWGAFTIQGV